MANPYVNKVEYFGTTKLDLTGDTVTVNNLTNGTTAHNAAGAPIVGTLIIQKYYTGSGAPASSLGQNGDIYLQE